jgi:hypothetical protein
MLVDTATISGVRPKNSTARLRRPRCAAALVTALEALRLAYFDAFFGRSIRIFASESASGGSSTFPASA